LKKIFIILAILSLTLAACGGASTKSKIVLFLARGGLGDKAFNDSANEGLQKAAQELGVEVKTFDYEQDNAEFGLRKFIRDWDCRKGIS
jgi:basic membrane protein A and related proteins